MSSDEAAAHLKVGRFRLYRLVDEAIIPAYKVGRLIRFRQSELDAAIEEGRMAPGELPWSRVKKRSLRSGDDNPG